MELITYTKAKEIILQNANNFGTQIIDLDDSLNSVLAQNIFAERDYPPFNRSAMDGIAINIKDFENRIYEFTIIKTIFAGDNCELVLKSGQCFKIMTGAAVPLCANVVIRIEDVEQINSIAYLKTNNIKPFLNIAQQGQDLKNSDLAITKGTIITPSIIGLLASLGKAKIIVNKLPTVAIITTGGEVIPLSKKASKVQIHNSNKHLITALLKRYKIDPVYCEHIIDDEKLIEAGVQKFLNIDILIICGGVSAGDADFVPAVLTRLGVQKLFHKVAIKPGKPIWCGKKPNGAMVFALPGNPLSCLVTFTLFIQLFINQTIGLPQKLNKTLPLNKPRNKKTKFDEFFPVVIDYVNHTLNCVNINGSGDVRLGIPANAIALHPSSMAEVPKDQNLYYWDL